MLDQPTKCAGHITLNITSGQLTVPWRAPHKRHVLDARSVALLSLFMEREHQIWEGEELLEALRAAGFETSAQELRDCIGQLRDTLCKLMQRRTLNGFAMVLGNFESGYLFDPTLKYKLKSTKVLRMFK